MSDTTNTILTAAGLAGALYLGHRWLKGKEAEPQTAPPVPAPAPVDDAAPVSSPAQLPDGGLPRTYDAEFVNHGQRIPLAYLRALAVRESDMNPNRAEGPSWGLLGVDDVTPASYNRRHRASFRQVDLLTPSINVAIAADQLRIIIQRWRLDHADIVNLQENWSNLRFVELLTFGWETAFSNRAGVGRVVLYLRHRGITDITVDKVFAHAGSAGASPKLSRQENLDFAKSVARLYDRERVTSGRSG
jgi:hypothetical protein